MLRSLLLLSLIATFGLGCANNVDSFNNTIVDTVDKTCERCAEDVGVTVAECMDLFDVGFSESQRQCFKDVQSRHDSVGPYFDCANEQAGRYATCVDDAGCNTVALEACGDILEGIGDVCPLPSGDALRELDACS